MIVIFDPILFKLRYPEFSDIPNALLGLYFSEAGIYLANTDTSPVQDSARRAVLLNMITAHIAYISGALEPDGRPRPVGRITSAGQGSISVGFDGVAPTPGSGGWFQQSQYGAAFWQSTSSLRGARYIQDTTANRLPR